jgi:hypothetical protein
VLSIVGFCHKVKTATYGAEPTLRIPQRITSPLVLPEVNGNCMQVFLTEVTGRYPGASIVMVLDGAGWHKSKSFAMPSNLTLLFLPCYAPELNRTNMCGAS